MPPQGTIEGLDVLRKRAKPTLTLRGSVERVACDPRGPVGHPLLTPSLPPPHASPTSKLLPREGMESSGELDVQVSVSGLGLYAHPEERLRGVWLQSKSAE